MSSKASIPVLRSGNSATDRFAQAVKQNLDSITGQRQNIPKLTPLESGATTAEIIAQLNAILQRLQG